MILLPRNLRNKYIAGELKCFRINGEGKPDGVDFQLVAKYLNRLSIIKPFTENKVHLRMVMSKNGNFSSPIATISTSDEAVRGYFKVFESSNDASVCGWADFTDAEGLSPQYNSKPIYFNIVDFLTQKCGITFTPETIIYVKYCWFSYDEEEHREILSDWYSMVFPSMAEVGASSSETVLRRDFQNLREDVVPGISVAVLDDYGCWVIKPGMNEIPRSVPANADDDVQFILKDYDVSKDYRIKLSVGAKPSGYSGNRLEVTFSREALNGAPAPINEDSDDVCYLDWNTNYYITVNMGMVVVHSVSNRA